MTVRCRETTRRTRETKDKDLIRSSADMYSIDSIYLPFPIYSNENELRLLVVL